jgi:hypothetical protein
MSRVRANTIIDQAGSGAPDFPNGWTAASGTVSGILTATSYDVDDLLVGSAATISATTESTSSTTGALVVSGGVGIAKSLTVGGNLSVGGTITYDDVKHVDALGLSTFREGINVTTGGISISGGGLDLVGLTTGLSVSGVATLAAVTATTITGSSVLTVSDTTQSTTKDTGAIILNGGIGCEKNLNVGIACSIEGLGISTFSGGMKVGGGAGGLLEKCHIEDTAWSRGNAGDNNINIDYGNVQLVTGDVLAGTGNTLNITSSVGINTLMSVGDVLAVTGITSVNASTAFVNTLQIDHATVQVAWTGGTAPTAGGSSGYDSYSFNIIKTANAKYAVIGIHVKAG